MIRFYNGLRFYACMRGKKSLRNSRLAIVESRNAQSARLEITDPARISVLCAALAAAGQDRGEIDRLLLNELANEPVAAFVSEGLGETSDFCPSDNT